MANKGEMPDIENAIRRVWELVVRGREARKNKAVSLRRIQKIVAICATALTSLGLASPILNAIQDRDVNAEQIRQNFAGLPSIILVIGGVLIFAIVVANSMMKESNIEEKAVLSGAFADSFEKLGESVRRALTYKEPMLQLEKLFEEAATLQSYYGSVMADTAKCQALIDEGVEELISTYCIHWKVVRRVPGVERRERR